MKPMKDPTRDSRTTLDPLRVIRSVVAGLARRDGEPPDVVVDGSPPHISLPDDGSRATMHLPAAPDFDSLDAVASRARAYIAHETAHDTYSRNWPADVLAAAKSDEYAGLMLNGTDDARIDTATLIDYPGAGLDIRRAVTDDAREFVEKGGDYGARSGALSCGAKYVLERMISADDARSLFNDDGRAAFDKMRPYLDRLARMIADGSALTDPATFGRESIRCGIAARGGDADEFGDGETPQNNDGNAETGDDGESNSGQTGDGESGDGESGDGDDESPDGSQTADGDDADGENGGGSFGGDESQTDGGDGESGGKGASETGGEFRTDTGNDFNPSDLAEKLSDAIAPAVDAGLSETVEDKTSAPVERAPTGVRAVDSGIARLSQEIRRAVKAPTRVIRSGKMFGDLDPHQFARAVAGCRDVFRTIEIRDGDSVAVTFLIDMSGSMTGKDAAAVSDAAAAIAGACDAVGFPVELLGYDGNWYGLRIVQLHRFGQRIDRDALRRIRFYGRQASGGTPTGAAMKHAAERLSRRIESRRILIVLTDGDAHDYAVAHDISRRCKANRIEVVGVSIGGKRRQQKTRAMLDAPVLDLGHSWRITPADVMRTLERHLVNIIHRARI